MSVFGIKGTSLSSKDVVNERIKQSQERYYGGGKKKKKKKRRQLLKSFEAFKSCLTLKAVK